jgi:hypothetical protein
MFRLSTYSDLPKIMVIVKQIVVEMSSSNNRQWDETYLNARSSIKPALVE